MWRCGKNFSPDNQHEVFASQDAWGRNKQRPDGLKGANEDDGDDILEKKGLKLGKRRKEKEEECDGFKRGICTNLKRNRKKTYKREGKKERKIPSR